MTKKDTVAVTTPVKSIVPVDVTDATFKANPFPFYAQLRAEAPVFPVKLPTKQRAWLITRYDDVLNALKDERFAKDPRNAMTPEQLKKLPWVPSMFKPLEHNMLDLDSPDHTRLRALVHKAFTPRLIEQMRDQIQALTDELLDGAEPNGGMDLIADFALPLPLTMIGRILGVPAQDNQKFHRWTKTLISGGTNRNLFVLIPSVMRFMGYMKKLIKERRANPNDDLVTALVQAKDGSDQLSEDEILAMIFLLLIAGHETTVNLIGSGSLVLLEHPDQLAKLRNEPALIKTAIEELVRLLTTVYTRAGGELTDPQEGCKLEDIKHKNISRRTAMLRSQTVNTIHDVHAQGKSVQAIAQELSISRTTVRKYLKHPEAVIPKPRPPRPSKLDAYKEQIKKWVMEDHCTNCEVLFQRVQKLGYTGGISILKEYVHPLRPAVAGHAPVQRYETKPGEQVQFDWGEFVYEHEGKTHKFYGFVAILGYSRMRFVTFVKRCDTPTLIRCLMEAFEYFGGLTKVALTDRMKSVLLEMVENKPRWNPRFADFMVSIAVAARVCKPYTPQTKGKVERTVSHVKKSLWGGITFTDLDDLNRQAHAWCERINSRVHRTTHARPVDRLAEEKLLPLPQDFAWERFATEERKVTWDGYVSYDGVLYGLPATLQLAGKQVQVRERKGVVSVWSAGTRVFEIAKRPRSQDSVPHAEQWSTVAPVSAVRQAPTPLGHLQPAPSVESRPLQEYDQYCGVETLQEVVA